MWVLSFRLRCFFLIVLYSPLSSLPFNILAGSPWHFTHYLALKQFRLFGTGADECCDVCIWECFSLIVLSSPLLVCHLVFLLDCTSPGRFTRYLALKHWVPSLRLQCFFLIVLSSPLFSLAFSILAGSPWCLARYLALKQFTLFLIGASECRDACIWGCFSIVVPPSPLLVCYLVFNIPAGPYITLAFRSLPHPWTFYTLLDWYPSLVTLHVASRLFLPALCESMKLYNTWT